LLAPANVTTHRPLVRWPVLAALRQLARVLHGKTNETEANPISHATPINQARHVSLSVQSTAGRPSEPLRRLRIFLHGWN